MSSFSSSGVPYIVRRHCGTYYWQAFIAGASRRGSLKTKSLAVAKQRVGLALEKGRKRWRKDAEKGVGELVTVKDWLKEWARRQGVRVGLKEATKDHDAKLARLLMEEEWSGIKVRRLRETHLRGWWRDFSARCEADTVNARLRVLRGALKLAVESGAMEENPAVKLERKKRIHRVIDLPGPEVMAEVVKSIRDQGRRFSDEAAAMVELAMTTGLRPTELAAVRGDDFRNGFLRVRGDQTGTKNRREREVPIVPALAELIKRMGWEEVSGKIFSIKSPRMALKRASERLGIARLRPYDLRHYFITRCIESGVDVPTVALWAGHQDGGALLMQRYTHVSRRHSAEVAKRLRF